MGGYREGEAVSDLQCVSYIQTKKLAGDERRCALLAMLHQLKDDVTLKLDSTEPSVLHLWGESVMCSFGRVVREIRAFKLRAVKARYTNGYDIRWAEDFRRRREQYLRYLPGKGGGRLGVFPDVRVRDSMHNDHVLISFVVPEESPYSELPPRSSSALPLR